METIAGRLEQAFAFVTLADAGNFTRAAAKLSRSKAWLSKQIAALERALGAQLVLRTTRRVALTESGKLYLEYCRTLRDTLGEATLVIEAGKQSGALITVEYALEQGRDVFAVPGQIFSAQSVGTNHLIRNGAGLVTCAQDILNALNLSELAIQQEVQAAMPEDATEASLLEVISYEPQHVDEILRQSELPITVVSSTLAIMELKGLVRQAGPMQYVLARESQAEYHT